jgi:hypothetical protein
MERQYTTLPTELPNSVYRHYPPQDKPLPFPSSGYQGHVKVSRTPPETSTGRGRPPCLPRFWAGTEARPYQDHDFDVALKRLSRRLTERALAGIMSWEGMVTWEQLASQFQLN